jgi:type IV pilus assembly protein PilC
MPTYEYTARDREGNTSSGVVIADDELQLRQSLRIRELYVTNFSVRSDYQPKGGSSSSLFKPRKVRLTDLVVMSRQMATLVKSGISIVEALDAVSEQSENAMLAEALNTTRLDVIGGDSLSQAMRKHPKVFNEVYCALVEAGEVGGMLEHTLEVAAEEFDKQQTLREQVRSALTYPIIVVVAAVVVVIFMLAYIVPIFAKIYRQFNAELPTITQLLVTISEVGRHWWFLFALMLVGIVILIRQYYASDQGRHVIDAGLLKMPILGKVLHKIAIAQFTNTWAGTTKGGIPIISALQVAARTSNNVIVRDAVMRVAEDVHSGASLATSLEEKGHFPPLVTRMVASGERSGNLDEMLQELTHFYERDIEYAVQRMTRMMEPALTVVVGSIVLFVLLALYMPVWNLARVIRK